MGGAGLELTPALRGGLSAAQPSVGYLFIIYGLWELSWDTEGQEGAGGQCWRQGTQGNLQVPALLAGKTGLLARPPRWQVATGGGTGLDGAGGPGTACVSPQRDTEVSRGGVCISVGEDPTLSPGFSSPPCAAVQPSAPEQQRGGKGGSRGSPPELGWRRTFTFTAF